MPDPLEGYLVRLRRLLAGLPSRSADPTMRQLFSGPMDEVITPGVRARSLMGMNERRQPMPLPPAPPPPAYAQPFAGMHNEPGLPPFEQPGGTLPIERYMRPPQAMPPPAVMPPPAAPPAMPPPSMDGAQGYGGPEPPPGTPLPYDPNTDPRYLPEQWRGAWNWQGRS
ncbi:MAG: hypothetical protein AB7G35_04510 [Hyphomicrobiaceae bacterium]